MKPPYAPGYMDKPPTSVTGDVAPPPWQGRSIAGPKLRLVEFSAFLEQQRDQDSVSSALSCCIKANYPVFSITSLC